MAYWRLFYHLVWASRDREPLIGPVEEAAIRRSFELTVTDLDLIPHAVGMMPDHVHVAISIPPKIAVAEAVRRLKGASAKAVNARTDRNGLTQLSWQGGYGALSFGDAALARVINYVEHQAEHHANGRFWSKLERADDDYEAAKRTAAVPT